MSHLFCSPLEEFKVLPLVHLPFFGDISLTNVTFSAFLVFLFTLSFSVSLLWKRRVVPSLPQILAENIYEACVTLIGSSLGKRGMVYFPYIFTLHIGITLTNLFGSVPYTSAVTAQFIITAGIGFSSFFGFMILSWVSGKVYIAGSFLPSGAPLWISPLLVVIEFVSFMFRPISLSVRLFANIMAGHALLIIINAFGYKFLNPCMMKWFASLAIYTMLFFIIIIETGVQVIQAYVFTLLTCSYLTNALYIDH
jgi:ATP synthase subunit 6